MNGGVKRVCVCAAPQTDRSVVILYIKLRRNEVNYD